MITPSAQLFAKNVRGVSVPVDQILQGATIEIEGVSPNRTATLYIMDGVTKVQLVQVTY